METLFFVLLAALVLAVGLIALFVAPARSASVVREVLAAQLTGVERGQERIERAVRDEVVQSRADASREASQLRDELRTTLKGTSDSVDQRLDRFAAQLVDLSSAVAGRLDEFQKRTDERLHVSHLEQVAELAKTSKALADSAAALRAELTQTVKGFGDSLDKRFSDSITSQLAQLDTFGARLEKLTETNEKKIHELRTELATGAAAQRSEITASVMKLSATLTEQVTGIAALLKKDMDQFSGTLLRLTESNEKRMAEMRATLDTKLQSIQEDNAKRLESMRQTVDEKLQGTLEKRLGESFKFVGERLEAVQAGLGEMRTLATGVGDLKKVLSNVKVRGTWGEIQLGNLLAQMLAPEQFATNVPTKPQSSERVEFAIRLPGTEDGEEVFLPIDSKFPIEDYQRLVEASERGDPEAVETCSRQLEQRIKQCAQDISSKYLNPPYTTEYGILFLPTESLYAEVLRRNGLLETLLRDFRVSVAGPTTLAALLNSLQMGFKTLAIQKRSSEVWHLLSAVKSEFGKFGDVIGAVEKKLADASKKLGDVGTRSRAIERKLRDVQELPPAEAEDLLLTATPVVPETVDVDEPEPVS